MCEEYESLHERSGKTRCDGAIEFPHSCSVWSRQKCLWIVTTWLTKIFHSSNMKNELRSYHNKMDWVNFVWMQDFWMLLKLDNTSRRKTLQISHNSVQWHVREYTLPRGRKASQPKGWIQGNTKIGPVVEVSTSYLHGKYGVEIRIWSLNSDNTHTWVTISQWIK